MIKLFHDLKVIGWLVCRPAAGGIRINTNSANQLGFGWGLAELDNNIKKEKLVILYNQKGCMMST